MSRPPENTLADDLAEANAKWQRLDSVAAMDWMMDPDNKPQFEAGGEGLPLIEGQHLFTSDSLDNDIILDNLCGHKGARALGTL